MDTNLSCLDPSLFQLSQLLEEDEVPLLDPVGVERSEDQDQQLDLSTATSSSTRKDDAISAGPTLPNIILEPLAGEEEQEEGQKEEQTSLAEKRRLETTSEEALVPSSMMVDSLHEAKKRLSEHQSKYGMTFIKRKNPRDFGQSDWRKVLEKKKIYWDGPVPFIKAANDACVYECQRGPDHDLTKREKRKRTYQDPSSAIVSSKKLGCPVKVVLEERIYFPQFKAFASSSRRLEAAIRCNRLRMRKIFSTPDGEQVSGQRKIHLSFTGCHNHSTAESEGGTASAFVSPGLIDSIYEMAHCNVHSASLVRGLLAAAVLKDGIKTAIPGLKETQCHVQMAENILQESKRQVDNLLDFAEERRSQVEETFHVRGPHFSGSELDTATAFAVLLGKSGRIEAKLKVRDGSGYEVVEVLERSESDLEKAINEKSDAVVDVPACSPEEFKPTKGFLLVYQSRKQSKMLDAHGSDIFFLDKVCEAVRSNLTFYFVQVERRNTLIPCALIVIDRTVAEESLSEALELLSRSNPEWRPSWCVTSHEQYLCKAVRNSLGRCKPVIGDKYRAMEWQKWFSQHPSPEAEKLKVALSGLASAASVGTFLERRAAARNLLSSFPSPARAYWEEVWLERCDCWVDALAGTKLVSSSAAWTVLSPTTGEKGRTIVQRDNRLLVTRAPVQLEKIVKRLVEEHFPSVLGAEELVAKARSSALKERVELTLESLRQLSAAVNYEHGDEGLLVISEILDRAVTNLIPIMRKSEHS